MSLLNLRLDKLMVCDHPQEGIIDMIRMDAGKKRPLSPKKHPAGRRKHPTCAALLTLVKPLPDRIAPSAMEEARPPTAMLSTCTHMGMGLDRWVCLQPLNWLYTLWREWQGINAVRAKPFIGAFQNICRGCTDTSIQEEALTEGNKEISAAWVRLRPMASLM